MSASLNVRSPRSIPLFLMLLVCLMAWTSPVHAHVGFRVSLLGDSSSSNLMARPYLHGISAFHPRAIVDNGTGARDAAVSFDSSYAQATMTLKMKDTHLLQPTILSYSDYSAQKMQWDVRKTWRDVTEKSYKTAGRTGTGEGIAIDLPYRIKSKTFRKLFGGDNVGVRVQGNISINGSLRRQSFDERQVANQANTNTAFRIDMVQQFTITGKIGQKVEVKVDQDSERMFDFENSLKLTYTGDEDEVIQKIEAGNVALNLGTKLATFSGKNTGLFGLKTQMKAGPLSVTGIASLERGQKNRLSSGNQAATRREIHERDYLQNMSFWVSNSWTASNTNRYVPNYREYYRRYVNRNHIEPPANDQIKEIEVWVSTNSSQTSRSGQAAAIQFIQHTADTTNFPPNSGNYEQTQWRLLAQGVDYDVNLKLGTIRLHAPLQAGQALGCAFRLLGGDTTAFGTLHPPTDNSRIQLVLLRPESPTAQDSTWTLMFRHVYSLGASGIDPRNFKLDIIRKSAATTADETGPKAPDYSNQTYLTFFDFDREGPGGSPTPDGQVDNYPAILDYNLGELCFLDLTPFDPSGYIAIQANGTPDTVRWPLYHLEEELHDSGQFTAPYLYNQVPSQAGNQSDKWTFRTEFKGSSSVYSLGVLVLENSEEVILNGQKLTRGVDYTVDYSSGELRILNDAAKASGANLDITYESGQTSTLDKTTLLGARAEYGLWQDSYVGGMLLYLNQSMLDKRVRIGMEPVRNTLWDANTSLKFKPDFLTRGLDALPLLRTEAPSDLQIDAEIARVYPNPNSLENSRTGDFNGLAYIDDFEGSRRSTPLGLSRRTWTLSSIPLDSNNVDLARGRILWYNPNTRDQVLVKDVFPNRDVNSNVANTLQSLIMEFKPDSNTDELGVPHPERSWGGVMRFLGEGYADETRAQYLEFWIDLKALAHDPDAKLIVDLGQISEDALPNDSLDTEDKPLQGMTQPGPRQSNGTGVLRPENDTGLDGKFGADNPPDHIPQDSARWNGPTRPAIPSYDDWNYSSGSTTFDQINGTEHNRNDEGGGYPDTEDLNNNQNLDLVNSYFTYKIELKETSPYIAGFSNAHEHQWRLFRIPISSDSRIRKEVGNPRLDNVKWARIYLTGFSHPDRFTKIEMVEMDIVSNEWLAAITSSDTTEYVSTAVINTHENFPGYETPPGVSPDRDPISGVLEREQSLVLKINDLNNIPNDRIPSEFFVEKNLFQALNMTEYKRLKMFVHGGDSLKARHFQDEKYQLILRFGRTYSDIANNYYDILETVRPDWDPQNVIDIAINDLSNLNRQRAAQFALHDSIHYPELAHNATGRFATDRTTTPWAGDSLVINGSPTMAQVGFVALGVRLLGKHYNDVVGRNEEIWVDELRVSDIYKDPGTAADISSSLTLADFAQLSGGYRTTDADFHNVNTRVGSNSSAEAVMGNATVQLQKIWLDRFNYRLPLHLSYNETTQSPRIIPGTDTRIQPSQAPDSIKSHTTTFSYGLQYSKGGPSKSKIVGWTLEKFTASWDYSKSHGSDAQYSGNNSEQSSAQAAYTFPTAKGRGVPFMWWTKRLPLLSRLADMRFYFKPTKLTVNGQAQKVVQSTSTRAGISTGSRQFQTVRSLNTGFAPFDPLTMDYTRTHRGQLLSGNWINLTQWDWGQTSDISQNLTNTYNPEVLPWLKPTFSYSSNYTWGNRNFSQSNQQAISNQRNLGTDLQLDFRNIFGEGGGGSRGRRGRDREHDHGGDRAGGMDEPGHGHGPAGPHDSMPGDSLGAPRHGTMPPRPPLPGDSLHVPPGRPGSHGNAPSDSSGGKTVSDSGHVRAESRSPLQLLGQVFKPIKTALTYIDPIALSYDNTAGHSQSGTLGQARPSYQFGFSQNPGLAVAQGYGTNPMTRKDDKITARSGLRVTQSVRMALNYSHDASETNSGGTSGQTSRLGSIDQTMFWLGTNNKNTAFPFMDVSLDWSGLEKIKFLSSVTKTITLSSALSNKVKTNWSGSPGGVTSREFRRDLNPLIRANVSWKGDIDSQIGFTTTSTFTNQQAQGSRTRGTDNRLTASVSYTIHTGFRVPLLIMRPIHLQNQTTFSLSVDYGKQKTEQAQGQTNVFAPSLATSSWSVQPRMTYSFSNTVQGQGYIQFQQTKNDINQNKSRVFEFGIQVNIAIRG